MNKLPKAIIFDYDGTLVDSERLWLEIHPLIFKHFNFKMDKNKALDIRSLGKPHIYKLMQDWYGISPEKFDEIEKYGWYLFNSKPYCDYDIKKPNVEETLKYLKSKNYNLVIVSGSPLKEIERKLKQFNLYSYFNHIFSTDEVKIGKPSPDVYLFACDKLGLKPTDCLVIEDSPNGVMSACSAGCKTIMIPDLTQPDESLKKYKFTVCKDLLGLKKII